MASDERARSPTQYDESDIESLRDSFSDTDDDNDCLRSSDYEPQTRFQTPPAALWLRSSQDAMDLATKVSSSTASLLDEEYDMLNMDDAETASLSSIQPESRQVVGDDTVTVDKHMESSIGSILAERVNNARSARYPAAGKQTARGSSNLDDGETPQQSALLAGIRGEIGTRVSDIGRLRARGQRLCITFVTRSEAPSSLEEGLLLTLAEKLTGQIDDGPLILGKINGSSSMMYRFGGIDVVWQYCANQTYDPVGSYKDTDLSIISVPHLSDLTSSAWIKSALEYEKAHQTPTMILLHSVVEERLDSAADTLLVTRSNIITSLDVIEKSGDHFWCQIEEAIRTAGKTNRHDHTLSLKVEATTKPRSDSRPRTSFILGLSVLSLIITMLIKGYWLADYGPGPELRRTSLSYVLQEHLNTTSIRHLNITHLIPDTVVAGSGLLHFWDQGLDTYSNVTFITAAPNHVIISMPKTRRIPEYPQITSTFVRKGSSIVKHDLTELIPGVYAVDVDPSQANGIATVDVLTKSPRLSVRVEADFGSRLLRRAIYNKAYTDLSMAVRRDLTIASSNAKALQEVLQAEIRANTLLAKSITEEVGGQVTRDLQTLTNGAMIVWDGLCWTPTVLSQYKAKAFVWVNSTQDSIQKDVKSVVSSAVKSIVPSRHLAKAREQALDIQRRIRGR